MIYPGGQKHLVGDIYEPKSIHLSISLEKEFICGSKNLEKNLFGSDQILEFIIMRTFGENSLLRKIKWHKNPFVSRASPLHTTTEKFIHLKNGQ